MGLTHDLLPVSAIAIVIISMVGVDLAIIRDPGRTISAIPIILFLLIWVLATLRVRRREQ